MLALVPSGQQVGAPFLPTLFMRELFYIVIDGQFPRERHPRCSWSRTQRRPQGCLSALTISLAE